jgi:hypothetical protein
MTTIFSSEGFLRKPGTSWKRIVAAMSMSMSALELFSFEGEHSLGYSGILEIYSDGYS